MLTLFYCTYESVPNEEQCIRSLLLNSAVNLKRSLKNVAMVLLYLWMSELGSVKWFGYTSCFVHAVIFLRHMCAQQHTSVAPSVTDTMSQTLKPKAKKIIKLKKTHKEKSHLSNKHVLLLPNWWQFVSHKLSMCVNVCVCVSIHPPKQFALICFNFILNLYGNQLTANSSFHHLPY